MKTEYFSKIPIFFLRKTSKSKGLPPVNRLTWIKTKKNSMLQIYLGTWYKKPFVDISYELGLIMLTRVGSIKKSLPYLHDDYEKTLGYIEKRFLHYTAELKNLYGENFSCFLLDRFTDKQISFIYRHFHLIQHLYL